MTLDPPKQSMKPHKSRTKLLLLIEQSEFALYAIHEELTEKIAETKLEIVPILASIQNEARMFEIMDTWRPETVYHTAAYKHVPLVEHNPVEGIKNNVLGTLTTAKVAIKTGVADFVLLTNLFEENFTQLPIIN